MTNGRSAGRTSEDDVTLREREGDGEESVVDLRAGWRAPDGRVRRRVALRPARVRDEWRALADFRVALSPDRLRSVLLARVARWADPDTNDDGERLDPGIIEALSAEDVSLLSRTYREMNRYPGGAAVT
jgi:hypothetical protein